MRRERREHLVPVLGDCPVMMGHPCHDDPPGFKVYGEVDVEKEHRWKDLGAGQCVMGREHQPQPGILQEGGLGCSLHSYHPR